MKFKSLFLFIVIILITASCHPEAGQPPDKLMISGSGEEWEEITYTYDQDDYLELEYHEQSDGQWYTISYHYDREGRVTNIHRGYPWGVGQYEVLAYYSDGTLKGVYNKDSDGKVSRIIYRTNGDILSYVYRSENWGWLSNVCVYSNGVKQKDIYIESTGIYRTTDYKYSSDAVLLSETTKNSYGKTSHRYYTQLSDRITKEYYTDDEGNWEVTYERSDDDGQITEIFYEDSEGYFSKTFKEYEGTNVIYVYFEDKTNYQRWESYLYDDSFGLKKTIITDNQGNKTKIKYRYYRNGNPYWILHKENNGYRALTVYDSDYKLVAEKYRYASGDRKRYYYAYHRTGQLRFSYWRDNHGNYQWYRYYYQNNRWKRI